MAGITGLYGLAALRSSIRVIPFLILFTLITLFNSSETVDQKRIEGVDHYEKKNLINLLQVMRLNEEPLINERRITEQRDLLSAIEFSSDGNCFLNHRRDSQFILWNTIEQRRNLPIQKSKENINFSRGRGIIALGGGAGHNHNLGGGGASYSSKDDAGGAGIWIASEGVEDNQPTFFFAPYELINSSTAAQISIDSNLTDQDFAGFVFGYEGPIEGFESYDHWLCNWGDGQQIDTKENINALASREETKNLDSVLIEFISTTESNEEMGRVFLMTSGHGNYSGQTDNICFDSERFGFYNCSQSTQEFTQQTGLLKDNEEPAFSDCEVITIPRIYLHTLYLLILLLLYLLLDRRRSLNLFAQSKRNPSSPIDEMLQNVFRFVSLAELDAALASMEDRLRTSNKEVYNEIILLQARLNNLRKREAMLTLEQRDVEWNRIAEAIVTLTQKIKANPVLIST